MLRLLLRQKGQQGSEETFARFCLRDLAQACDYGREHHRWSVEARLPHQRQERRLVERSKLLCRHLPEAYHLVVPCQRGHCC